jgi:hypothetical protein
MKTLKYIFLLILVIGTFQSCLVEETTKYDLNDDGPNLAGFEQPRTSFSFVTDGEEYNFTLRMKVIGPKLNEIAGPVTVTIAADPSSTAIEGTHFRIDQPTMTLDPENNFLGLWPITILTDGIQAPLDEAPVILLNVVDASGDPSVINNGKPIEVTLNYGCFSNLTGTYDVTTEYTGYTGVVTTLTWTEAITQTGIGTYRTERVGHWVPSALGGTPGFTFNDVCNVITVPGQNLVDLYSNWVEGTDFGTVDPVTGNLYIEYSICVTGTGCRLYKSTYVKQ